MNSYVERENSSTSATTTCGGKHCVCHHSSKYHYTPILHPPHHRTLWMQMASESGRDDSSLELRVMPSEDDGGDHFPPLPRLSSSTLTSSVKALAMSQEHDARMEEVIGNIYDESSSSNGLKKHANEESYAGDIDVEDGILNGDDDEVGEEEGRYYDRREGMPEQTRGDLEQALKLPQLSPAAAIGVTLLPDSAATYCDFRPKSQMTMGLVINTRELSPGPPKRNIHNRAMIEAELFNLRSSRNGFVRSESLRVSIRRVDDNDNERIVRELDGRRRWHRRECEDKKRYIEEFRKTMRRVKDRDWRLIFLRRHWSKFDCNGGSKVADSEFPIKKIRPVSGTSATGCNVRRDRQSTCNEGVLLVNFPSERKRSSSSDHGDKNSREKKNIFQFWMAKKKKKMSSIEITVITSCDDDSNKEKCGTDYSSSGRDDTVQIIELDGAVDQEEDSRHDDEDANENSGRKNVVQVVVGVVAAASVSSLGIAFAIILL